MSVRGGRGAWGVCQCERAASGVRDESKARAEDEAMARANAWLGAGLAERRGAKRVMFVLACVVMWGVVCGGGGARVMADVRGPLIAELVDYPDVRAVVPASTAEVFARVVGAEAAQRDAAGSLVSGARTELSRVINRHLRTVRDDPTLEEMKQSEAKVLKDAGEVERALLGDLFALLTEEQQRLFPAFERAHRRSLLALRAPQPMPLNVWEFFAARGLDVSADARVAGILERFDRDSDAALVRQQTAERRYIEGTRRVSDGSDEARARERAALNEFLIANAEIARVHAAVVEPLLGALPPEVADALTLEIIARAIKEFDGNLANPERFPVVREVLALEITAEQRGRVASIVDAAKAESLKLAREGVVEQARFVLLDDEQRTDGRTSPLNLYLGKASDLRVRVSGEVLAVLTEEQRLAYDASEVLEPSSSSVVNDE